MGFLSIDHRGGTNPDGGAGDLKEYSCVVCKHCGGVIAILLKGCSKHYNTKFSCPRCRGPICRRCGGIFERTGLCNPIKARIEHAIKFGGWDEHFQHQYAILPK